jgi:oligosaccharyltransferase complex subunit delta (ribophorin II)
MAAANDKKPPITADQATKFANFFVSRKSVNTPKGAYSLLDVLQTLTSNKVILIIQSLPIYQSK